METTPPTHRPGSAPASRPPGLVVWGFAVLAWWTAQGLATASQYRLLRAAEGASVEWSVALLTALASAYLWIPLTAVAFWLTWRHPLEGGRWAGRLWIHLAAGLGAHLFRVGAVLLLNPIVGWYAALPTLRQLLVQNLANNTFLYWLIVGVAHALLYARRAQERARVAERLRADLARTELENLRSRLHPHFLFNALNTVASLVRDRPEAAERVVTRLSELLRHALESSKTDEIPLADELRLLEAYLEVEEARFEDRLRVVWRIDPGLEDARVPPLLLQPLVENALRHGISARREGGTVEIRAARIDGSLRLTVRDDGAGAPTPEAKGSGVGIGESRARLDALYGRGADLTLTHPREGGSVAEATIPWRRGGTLAAPSPSSEPAEEA